MAVIACLRARNLPMSAAPRYPSDLGYAGLRMTADEYLALGETQERYEQIEGVVVMSPSPRPKHQMLVSKILYQLERANLERGDLDSYPDTDLRLDSGQVYRPDASIFRKGRLEPDPVRLDAPPDLVIEVLSPGSKVLDLITMRDDYERFGMGEYWVIDPEDLRFRAWRREGPRLLEFPVADDTVMSATIQGLTVDLAAIRRQFGA